ncbi:MAG: YcaO-like family protein, partial [Sneathiellales bacterium]|nr:YcaO-like family protein [Sneathiellales bacterium]
ARRGSERGPPGRRRLWWHGSEPANEIDPDFLQELYTRNLLPSGVQEERRIVRYLDITTEFGLPVIVAMSSDPDGNHIICGIACETTLSLAVVKAYLEMRQMELAQFISARRLSKSGPDKLSALNREHLKRYQLLNIHDYRQFTPLKRFKNNAALHCEKNLIDVQERILQHGFNIYSVNLTRSYIDIPVFRTIIPGLQPPNTIYFSQRLKRMMEKNQASRSSTKFAPWPL